MLLSTVHSAALSPSDHSLGAHPYSVGKVSRPVVSEHPDGRLGPPREVQWLICGPEGTEAQKGMDLPFLGQRRYGNSHHLNQKM